MEHVLSRGECPYCSRYTSGDICPAHGYVGAPKQAATSAAFPFRGAMVMYSGPAVGIPQGWQLCNGTNGTPDYRLKFVMGSTGDSGSLVTGSTGGSNTHSHSVPSGSLSVSGSTSATGAPSVTPTISSITIAPHGQAYTGSGTSHAHGNTDAPSATTTRHEGSGTSWQCPTASHVHATNAEAAHTHLMSGVQHAEHDHTIQNASHTHTASFTSTGTLEATTSGTASSIPEFYASAIIMYMGV